MSPEQENAMIYLLLQVKEVLDGHDVEFWLDCGTLLGAVREGNFLSWEHDIDFGTWRSNIPDSIKNSISNAFINRGLKVWVAENHINIAKDATLYADIDFYHLINDKAIKPTLLPRNVIYGYLRDWLSILSSPFHPRKLGRGNLKCLIKKCATITAKAMPSLLRKGLAQNILVVYEKIGAEDISWVVPGSYFLDLSTIRFYGMEFKVPATKEEYLAYRYGDDWRTPRRDWITSEEDGAIIGKQ